MGASEFRVPSCGRYHKGILILEVYIRVPLFSSTSIYGGLEALGLRVKGPFLDYK